MPELQKLSPDLFNKIKGKTPGTIDINEIEENPQWQEWLDKSGITRKMEEFNEIQLEGGDVFISTFSKLKSYPILQHPIQLVPALSRQVLGCRYRFWR